MAKEKSYCEWAEVPVVLTLGQVSIVLGKSYECIRRWAVQGIIPATKIGDEWRVEKSALQRFLYEKGNNVMQSFAS